MKIFFVLLKFMRPSIAVRLLMFLLCLAPTSFVAGKAEARKLSFVRDAEIESTIRIYATPLFQAANLEPSAINIYLIKDRTLNAFVAGGQKLFLNTGLLIRTQNAGQVIGVIAHETGHIAGGHLSRTHEAMKKSSAATILAMVLGGVAVIGGRGDVGTAIIAGGQQMGVRSLLQYSRTQESAADAAAMRFLDATQQSAQGLLDFFDILGEQELLSMTRQDPYYRSHPLTRERRAAVENFITHSPNTNRPELPGFDERHSRMKAKLKAFVNPISRTLREYKEDDPSIEARYARAIAYFKRPDLERAIPLVDGLIAERPNDPYFNELKGQMLFENGRVRDALPYYEKAVLLAPDSALLQRSLGQVQLEVGDPALLENAVSNLLGAKFRDNIDPFTWQLLGTAYGKMGKRAESSLALGEAALLTNRLADAKFHAERASGLLEEGSVGWIHAQDILHALENKK
jgi:predicted Zn-dependent protease